MKAVITNDQGNLSLLKLRLVSEGANDRTLMLLLELQYPMIHRLHSIAGSSPGALPESLEVPIASGDEARRSQESVLSLCSGKAIMRGHTVTIRSAPWEHASLLGARLWILDPEGWEIRSVIVNGRCPGGEPVHIERADHADLAPLDVHPGTIVELTVKCLEQAEPYRSLEAFLSKTEAEAVMYRMARDSKSVEAAVGSLDAMTRSLLHRMVTRDEEIFHPAPIAGAIRTALALVDGASGAEHSWEDRTVLARIVGSQFSSESEAVRKLIVAVDARQKVMGKPWPVD